jgi:hypothetical protein
MASGKPTIKDRSMGSVPRNVRMVDWVIAQHPDPDAYRAEIVDACSDPRCTYQAIASAISEDIASVTLEPERLRKWWRTQPEYDDVEFGHGEHPRSRS